MDGEMHRGVWLPRIHVDQVVPATDGGFIYLATPYTKYRGGLEAAARAACLLAGALIRRDVPVFCPIAESHTIALVAGLDMTAHGVWMRQDLPKLRMASALLVAEIDGWRDSRGVSEEIDTFKPMGRPMGLVSVEGLL